MSASPANDVAVAGQIARASLRVQAQCQLCEMSPHCEAGSAPSPDLLAIPKGEALYLTGDAVDYLYSIRKGAVKTSRYEHHGGEQVLGFYFNGEVFGLDGLASEVRDHAAVALEDCVLCRVPLRDVAAGNRAGRVLRLFSSEALSTQERALLNRHQANERLAAFLLDVAGRARRKEGGEISFVLPMSRQEVASYLGMTPETVCRRLCRMERAGWIAIADDRKMVRLLNLEPLQQLAYAALSTDTEVSG